MAGNNSKKPTLELHWAPKVPSWTDATGPWFLSLRFKFTTLFKWWFSFKKISQIVAGYDAKFKHASSLHSITNQTELQVLVLKSQQLRTAVEGAADGLAPVIPGPSHSSALMSPNNFLSARAHSSYGFVKENCPRWFSFGLFNISSVVEFQNWWVLKSKIFGQESTYSNVNLFLKKLVNECEYSKNKAKFYKINWIKNWSLK